MNSLDSFGGNSFFSTGCFPVFLLIDVCLCAKNFQRIFGMKKAKIPRYCLFKNFKRIQGLCVHCTAGGDTPKDSAIPRCPVILLADTHENSTNENAK
jgi:hypothetical protein